MTERPIGSELLLFSVSRITKVIPDMEIPAKIARFYINVMDGHIVALGAGRYMPELDRQVAEDPGWRNVTNLIWRNVRDVLGGGVETFYPLFVKKDLVCAFMLAERANLAEDERTSLDRQ
jgi:hypothetical protein